jgi:hypothetical protein
MTPRGPGRTGGEGYVDEVGNLERRLDGLANFLQRPATAVAGLSAILLALLSLIPQADPDLFARVAVGRLVELHGSVLPTDPFSFSPRLDRWVDHEWLSGVVFYHTAGLAGDQGLLTLCYGLMLLTLLFLLQAHRELIGTVRVRLPWLLLTIPLLFVVWGSVVRCRVFTFLFLSILLLALVRWRSGRKRWIWALPFVFVLWANLHGGFVAGLGLLGVSTLAVVLTSPRESWPLLACLLLSLLGTLINPYGLEYWDYILGAVLMERPEIQEWRSPDLVSLQILLSLFLLTLVFLGQRNASRRIPPEGWGLISVAFLGTLWAERIFTFLLAVLAVYGTPSVKPFGHLFERRWPEIRVAAGRVFPIAYLLGLAWIGWGAVERLWEVAGSGLDYDFFPVQATEWLERRGRGGNVLVHFDHGSYALWRLYPDYRVSMDGRYEEVYPQATVDLNRAAILPEHPQHEEALRILAPDYIIAPDLLRAKRYGPGWRIVHEDARFAVLAGDRVPDPLQTPRPARPMWQPGF